MEITAETDDGEVMGVRHREHPVEGVQFRPVTVHREIEKLMRREVFTLGHLLQGAGFLGQVDYPHGSASERPRLGFLTCFISFTATDDAFSKRLYDDLRNIGIFCWRWKEDAKWGRTLMGEVDEAIRLYDKLIVVLSHASLISEPVIREIERALQKEQREGKEVLFPIRVDDAIFSWRHALQADILRKVIGDFRNWQEPRMYEGALRRLAAALRADPRRPTSE